MAQTLANYVGGAWIPASTTRTLNINNPATGETVCQVPLSRADDVERAVTVANGAFETWREVPAVQRARYLFRFKALLDRRAEDLAKAITAEHGKTLDEARAEVRRGIENVEHACGIPTLLMGDSLEEIAAGIDCQTVRQPLGVFAAITPFNFPAMVPLWFFPYAVATGNTCIVKPSELTPYSQNFLFELIEEAGFPAGVVNLVHGDREVAEALVDHPDVVGVSFVGSTPVARSIYRRAAEHGKRVQALGSAKNHVVVMPDADLDKTVATIIESSFGCAGQRCLAGSVVIGVGDVYEPLRERLVAAAEKLVVGNGMRFGVDMGPVVSPRAKDRILTMIESGLAEGAELLVDGRHTMVKDYPNGNWVGPTILGNVAGTMRIAKDELFGPVMLLRQSPGLSEAIDIIRQSEYANATSIFTASGKSARSFRHRVGVSMVGVNIGVAAPMAFFPFGGTKSSFFGDTKAHGKDAIRFYTDQKVTISRWF